MSASTIAPDRAKYFNAASIVLAVAGWATVPLAGAAALVVAPVLWIAAAALGWRGKTLSSSTTGLIGVYSSILSVVGFFAVNVLVDGGVEGIVGRSHGTSSAASAVSDNAPEPSAAVGSAAVSAPTDAASGVPGESDAAREAFLDYYRASSLSGDLGEEAEQDLLARGREVCRGLRNASSMRTVQGILGGGVGESEALLIMESATSTLCPQYREGFLQWSDARQADSGATSSPASEPSQQPDPAPEPEPTPEPEPPADSQALVPSDATNCGEGVFAGANTSCPFATRVADAYAEGGGSSHVTGVYSPVTGEVYDLTCRGLHPVVCSTGTARIYITRG